MDIDFLPAAAASRPAVAAALTAAFGRPFTEEWLAWKHDEGPWGPVEGTVAMADGELLGCRFLLPWAIRCDGEVVLARRAVEAATTPAGRGRGLFRRMNELEMARLGETDGSPFIFSTANEQSRPAYRKLGWVVLDPFEHGYSTSLPRPAALRTGAAVLDSSEEVADVVDDGRARTAWTAEALRWRTDPRSGHKYGVAGLARADGPNGAVVRVVETRGIRVLLVLHSWGSRTEQGALLGGLLWRTRAVALLHTAGSGARPPDARTLPLRRAGSSHIALWRGAVDRGLDDRRRWALAMVDVEGVL